MLEHCSKHKNICKYTNIQTCKAGLCVFVLALSIVYMYVSIYMCEMLVSCLLEHYTIHLPGMCVYVHVFTYTYVYE